MLHLYESLFRAGYGEHPERFLSKDELDDYRASLSYYNSQYLEFRCGLCVGLKLGSLSSLLL